MNSRLNRMFGRGEPSFARDPLATTDWAPAVDIVETPEEFQVKTDLPEMKREDIKVGLPKVEKAKAKSLEIKVS